MRKLPWAVWIAVVSAGVVLNPAFADENYRTTSGLLLTAGIPEIESGVNQPVKVALSTHSQQHHRRHYRKQLRDVKVASAVEVNAIAVPFERHPLSIQGQIASSDDTDSEWDSNKTEVPSLDVPRVTYTLPQIHSPEIQGQGNNMSAAHPPMDIMAPKAPAAHMGAAGAAGGSKSMGVPSQPAMAPAVQQRAPTAPAAEPGGLDLPDLPMESSSHNTANSAPVTPQPPIQEAKPQKKAVKHHHKSHKSKPKEKPEQMISNQELVTEDAIKKSQEWIDSKEKFTYGEDGKIVYTYGVGMPVIVCAPLRITDLELQPGERVNGQVHAGDTTRWIISPAESGSGSNSVTHLIIKPREAGLETNMIIPTDRRVYYIKLVSSEKDYVARIAFSYPEDAKKQWTALEAAQTEDLSRSAGGVGGGSIPSTAYGGSSVAASATSVSPMFPERLFFDYEIAGDDAPWKPIRVFDDGQKTFIQVPPEARNGEIPALMIIGPDRSEQLVNYRFRDNYYVVDRIFDRAVLLIGVGREQQKVTITRKSASKRAWSGSWNGGR